MELLLEKSIFFLLYQNFHFFLLLLIFFHFVLLNLFSLFLIISFSSEEKKQTNMIASLLTFFAFQLLFVGTLSLNTYSIDMFEREIHRRINHLYFTDLTNAVTEIVKTCHCPELSLLPRTQLCKRVRALEDVIPSYFDKFESKNDNEYFSPRLRYHELFVDFFQKVSSQVRRQPKQSMVLDVGCGAGLSTTYLLRSLQHQTTRVLAVDKDPFMIALSKVSHRSRKFINYHMDTVYDHFLEDDEIKRVDYKLMDFRKIGNFGENTFTSVNMNFVLDEVHAFETMKMLRSAKQLLKHDGYLSLLHQKEPGTEYTYLISPSMNEILYSIGFRKVEKIEFKDFSDFEGYVAVV